ncbi:putative beta-fructofuranosidase [Helianthus annuus]|nr:putative beta-fructofuranosidase [Helianthus annuus]KAJ0765314.1 putative beta-fructofuranosidase [Helianthus annuus]
MCGFTKLAWVLVFLICLNICGDGGVMAFHNNYETQTRNHVKVKQVYRTGYHLQPKKNWINGMSTFIILYNLSIISSRSSPLYVIVYVFLLFIIIKNGFVNENAYIKSMF